MDQLKKFFPWSFKALDVKALVIAIIIYIVIGFIGGLIIGLLSIIPFIGGFFAMNAFAVEVVLALFGTIFVGLYQAAFFDETEVTKCYAEVKAEAAEANAAAAN